MADLTSVIQGPCQNYLQKLNDLHDDYAHTRMLWFTLQVSVQRYHRNPTVKNPTTGSVTEGIALAGKAGSPDYDRFNREVKGFLINIVHPRGGIHVLQTLLVHLPHAQPGRAADHLADEPKVSGSQLRHPPGERAE